MTFTSQALRRFCAITAVAMATGFALCNTGTAFAVGGTACSGDIDPGYPFRQEGAITVAGTTYGAFRVGARWTASKLEFQVAVDDVRTDGLPPYVYWKGIAADGTRHTTPRLHNYQTAVAGWECHTGALSTGDVFTRFELWGSPDNAPSVPEVQLVSIPDTVPPLPAPVDADADGFTAEQDCDDTNPAIRPGAREQPGNEVDENCDGVAEPFQLINIGIRYRFEQQRHGTRLTVPRMQALTVTHVPANARVRITCRAPRRPRSARRSCTFSGRRLQVARPTGQVKLARLFKHRRLAPHTTIRVAVSAPAVKGKQFTFRITKANKARLRVRCMTPTNKRTKCT
jgi:hypothetical protein